MSAEAAGQYRALDTSLQIEVIEQVAALAESPAEYLRCYRPLGSRAGLYTHSFGSAVVAGLTISLLFGGFDEPPQRLVLVEIGHSIRDPDEAE